MTNDCIAQARLYHAAADDGLLSAVTGGGRGNGGEGVKGVEGVELLRSQADPHPQPPLPSETGEGAVQPVQKREFRHAKLQP